MVNKRLPIIIYSDSQAALKAVRKAEPLAAQNLLRQVYEAADSLMSHGVVLRLQWVLGHRNITGNEKADLAAKKAAKTIGPIKKPQTRYLTAVYSTLVEPLVNQT